MRIQKLSFALFLVAGCSAADVGNDEVVVQEDSNIGSTQDELAKFLPSDNWAYWSGGVVNICWEASTNAFPNERIWTLEKFRTTWGRAANVSIKDRGPCSDAVLKAQRTVPIVFSDEQPKLTLRSTNPPKLVLNPTFATWGSTCAASAEARELCFMKIAAHEWGHVLGFGHEQNRNDATICAAKREPTYLTGSAENVGQYDPNSIMHYHCVDPDPNWNNHGDLSELDEAGIQAVYGPKKAPLFLLSQAGTAAISMVEPWKYVGQSSSYAGFGAWSHVTLLGNGYALFYHAPTGAGYVAAVTDAGQYVPIRSLSGFNIGFTHVVSVGYDGIVLYDSKTGVAATASIDDGGNYRMGVQTTAFAAGADHVAGFRNGSVFFLRNSTGVAQTGLVTSLGAPRLVSTLSGFSAFTQVTSAGANALFLYDSPRGIGVTATVDGDGKYAYRTSISGGSYFTHVVGSSTGFLFLYRAGSTTGAYAHLSANGGYTFIGNSTSFDPSFRLIAAR